MRKLLSLIFIFSVLACKSKVNLPEGKQEEVLEVPSESTPEILILSLRINSKDSVKIINTLTNFGRLRGSLDTPLDYIEEDLRVSFLSKDGNVCAQKIIPNPLMKRYEYAAGDSLNILTSKSVEVEQAEFYVRIQWDECFELVSVDKFYSGEWRNLNLLQLDKPKIQ